jgi:hypothetical protein
MMKRSAVVVCCAALVSCTSADGWPTKPDVGVPVVDARYEFVCGRWQPSAPPIESTFVDLSFYAFDQTGPPAGVVNDIRELGGRVVRVFNVPRVRVVMDVAVVSRIWSGRQDFAIAEAVQFPESFRVPVIVEMRRTFTNADRLALESIGGHVNFTFDRFVVGWLDDDRVPDARALPDVVSVGLSVPDCELAAR